MDIVTEIDRPAVRSTRTPGDAFVPRLVADTLETRLAQAIASSRTSPAELAKQDEAFRRACRRDAITAIELGRALGLLPRVTRHVALCHAGSDAVADDAIEVRRTAATAPVG